MPSSSHCRYALVNTSNTAVMIMFFDFSNALNTIQLWMLGEKIKMQVESALVSWVFDYLTCTPQYVRL